MHFKLKRTLRKTNYARVQPGMAGNIYRRAFRVAATTVTGAFGA